MGDEPFAMVSRSGQDGDWYGVDSNVDVERTDDGYAVMADLPGFETEDLSLQFEDGVLTIQGEAEAAEEAGRVSRRRGRRFFERLTFPETVVAEDITASYHNGVLEVTLPTEGETDDAHRIDID